MTQATKFGAPLQGPMAPATVTAQIDDSLNALLTGHLGSSRPEYLDKFGVWTHQVDTNTAKLKMFNGDSDVELFSVNTSNGDVSVPALTTKVQDSEKLDGVNGPKFARRDVSNTFAETNTFNKIADFKSGLYLNNEAVISSRVGGINGDLSGDNIDHIWHDDGDWLGTWNFCSDTNYKSAGNAKIRAGRMHLYNNWETTNTSYKGLLIENKATGKQNITANRSNHAIEVHNHTHVPANGSTTDGTRFYNRGVLAHTRNYDGGQLQEMSAIHGDTRHYGPNYVNVMYGGYFFAYVGADATGDVNDIYSLRSRVDLDAAVNIDTVYGHKVEVNPDSNNPTMNNVYGQYVHMDHDSGTLTGNVFALYQNFDGSWSGKTCYGIYQNEVDKNYLTGNLEVTGDVTALSDIRTKTDIETISDALKLVMGMRGVNFTKDEKRCSGVIAQEMQKIMPEVVTEGENGMLSVAYGNLTGVLIEAVKELSSRVEKLETRNAVL